MTTTATSGPGLGGGLGNGAASRLPVPPRERKPALAALAVLLILGGALVSAYLVMASGQRVSAIRIKQPVAAGQQIPASALEEVPIGNTGIEFVRWTERDRVTKTYAAVGLVPGALLTTKMAVSEATAAKGRVIIGLALKQSQVPVYLQSGDHVALYAVGGRTDGVKAGTLLSSDAIVYQMAGVREGRTASSASETRISVTVPPEQAQALTQAASAGAVAVAVIPPGTTVPIPAPQPPSKTGG